VLLEVAVAYDCTKLSTADLLRVKAASRYDGEMPTNMVIVDLEGVRGQRRVPSACPKDRVASLSIRGLTLLPETVA
jgi:hypothetical protein